MTLSTENPDLHFDENNQPEDIYGEVPPDAWMIRESLKEHERNAVVSDKHPSLP